MQDSRSRGSEAAQGALLPGTARSRICGKDGRSAVRLSHGEAAEEGRSRIDAAYPADTAIHLILDNHSAHISRETRAWLAEQPAGRFEFTFTPTHGSWLNLVEGFFSKLARSVLRHIRVSSKQELTERLMAAVDYFNRAPVVHTSISKLDKAA